MKSSDDNLGGAAPGSGAQDTQATATSTGQSGPANSRAEGSSDATPGTIVGTAMGRYTVEGTLGEGAMGKVYAAYDPDLDRRVAIKLLQVTTSQRNRHRLEREARALARVSHPNVVQVYDVGRHGKDVFVAMELVEGQSLTEWVREKNPSWREIVDVYLDAARGIAAAHEKGLVHRDIKPDNVLIGNDGRVRVADFGLAAAQNRPSDMDEGSPLSADTDDMMVTVELVDEPSNMRVPDDSLMDRLASASAGPSTPPSMTRSMLEGRLEDRLTQTGTLLGTPAYMAPEQHLGSGDVGPAADQYGLCASIYAQVYKVQPFKASDGWNRLEELLWRKRSGEFTAPPKESDVPVWLRQVLLRGMAAEPRDRYPSMQALIAALEDDPALLRRERLHFLDREALILGNRVLLVCDMLEQLRRLTVVLFRHTPKDPAIIDAWLEREGFAADETGYCRSQPALERFRNGTNGPDELEVGCSVSLQHDPTVRARFYALRNLAPDIRALRERIEGIAWTYYQDVSNAIVIYPPLDLSKVVPHDFDWHAYHTYAVAGPEANPERKIRWTPPNIDYGGEGLIITASIPVYSDSDFHGLWNIDIPVRVLLRHTFEQAPVARDQVCFVVDREGHILMHPILQAVINQEKGDIYYKRLADLGTDFGALDLDHLQAQGAGELSLVNGDGVAMLCTFQVVPAIGWILFLTTPLFSSSTVTDTSEKKSGSSSSDETMLSKFR